LRLPFVEGVFMRLRLVVTSLFFLCAGAGAFALTASASAPTCVDLHLVPAPRECAAVQATSIGRTGLLVSADKNVEDAFTGKDLSEQVPKSKSAIDKATRIWLLRAESNQANALLAHNHLTFDPAMHDEGYILVPDGKSGLAVIAESSAGLFYGAQTVKQLIRGSGKDTVLLVPTIRDWPAMAHRGVSDDWSRGPLPNMDFLKREIRTLAAYKINTFSPYFEQTFAYDSSPVAAFPGGAMTADEARELVAYAAQYHITIIPEQESFGHLHNVLKYEQFSALGETPHGAVLAPGDAATLPLISSWPKSSPAPTRTSAPTRPSSWGWAGRMTRSSSEGLARSIWSFSSRFTQRSRPTTSGCSSGATSQSARRSWWAPCPRI
jgi:hexosaminidase